MIVFQSSDNRRSFASDDSADLLEGGTGNLEISALISVNTATQKARNVTNDVSDYLKLQESISLEAMVQRQKKNHEKSSLRRSLRGTAATWKNAGRRTLIAGFLVFFPCASETLPTFITPAKIAGATTKAGRTKGMNS